MEDAMRLICESMHVSRDVMTQVDEKGVERDKIYTGRERAGGSFAHDVVVCK